MPYPNSPSWGSIIQIVLGSRSANGMRHRHAPCRDTDETRSCCQGDGAMGGQWQGEGVRRVGGGGETPSGEMSCVT